MGPPHVVARKEAEQECLVLLQRILRLWPKGEGQQGVAKDRLKAFLAPDFDDIDLIIPVPGLRELGPIESTEATVTIYFDDAEGCPQRAIFKDIGGQEWKLRSLTFECPVCFGTGKNDETECPICGGSGWGAH